MKLCLIGESAVGKTRLIRRFAFNQFDGKYSATLGTKITKKVIEVQHPNNGELVDILLMIWDILGAQGFRQTLQDAYFFGAQGILGVCDVTRENTLLDLHSWMDAVLSVTKEIPIVFLGNQCDLVNKQQVDLNELKLFSLKYENAMVYLSSANTGENVESAFRTLSESILKNMVA